METSPSAEAVRALRLALGLTQDELAQRAGVSRVEIVGLEKGRYKGRSVRMRDGLARAFGLAPADLSAALSGEKSVSDVVELLNVAPSAVTPTRKKASAKKVPARSRRPSSDKEAPKSTREPKPAPRKGAARRQAETPTPTPAAKPRRKAA